jgi:hypothetical protein
LVAVELVELMKCNFQQEMTGRFGWASWLNGSNDKNGKASLQ